MPFQRGHVTGLLQLSVLPATHHAEFDLVPVTFDQGAVQLPVAVADHHAIGLSRRLTSQAPARVPQSAPRAPAQRGRWHALLTLQFRSDPFGVGAQRLAANVDTG